MDYPCLRMIDPSQCWSHRRRFCFEASQKNFKQIHFQVNPPVHKVLLHLLVAGNDVQGQQDAHDGRLKWAEDQESPFSFGVGGQDGGDDHQRDGDDGAEGQREVIRVAALISCK